MIKIFVTRNFDTLIRFILDEYELNPSWRVVILDDEECNLFFNERPDFISYHEEFFGLADVVKEHDDEPETHDSFYACCIPCSNNKDDIEEIKGELDQKRLVAFNCETKFIQRLFTAYVDHLILINDESFSELPGEERPDIIAHEAFHIIEYELYDQTHKCEEVNETARKLVEQYFSYLSEEQRKRELNKICSNEIGNAKYQWNRIV